MASGVALFLRTGNQLQDYEFLEEECIETAYGVTGMAKEYQARLKPRRDRGILVGVLCCIFSLVPLFAGLMLSAGELYMACSVPLLLALVALGVWQFVSVCMPWEGAEKLLQEGDFSPRNKKAAKWTGMVTGVYWLGTVALYLAISLPNDSWESSWVLWPVAGVLFALVMVVCDFIKDKLYK